MFLVAMENVLEKKLIFDEIFFPPKMLLKKRDNLQCPFVW